MRSDGRAPDELRPLSIQRGFTKSPAGSVLIAAGGTRLLATASITEQLPLWLKGADTGWVTAEYAMLPGATPVRKIRDGRGGKVDGRSQEIQRLIGRSLRAVTDLKAFPDRAIWLDCDVLEADGGTRTLAVTGAWIALHDACRVLLDQGALRRWPLKSQVAAVSVGLVGGQPLLDLSYPEDSQADVDLNVVMTGGGEYVEVQGSAEGRPFTGGELQELLGLAARGVERLLAAQKESLER